MPTIYVAFTAIAGTLLYGIYKAIYQLLRPYFSSLRDIPGPKSNSLIYGHVRELRGIEDPTLLHKWVEQYGKVVKIRMFAGVRSYNCIRAFEVLKVIPMTITERGFGYNGHQSNQSHPDAFHGL